MNRRVDSGLTVRAKHHGITMNAAMMKGLNRQDERLCGDLLIT